MKINKKKVIYAWMLGDKIQNCLGWAEGNAGAEYAVLDHIFKNKRAFDNMPFFFKDRLKRVKITLEEIKENE